MIEFKPRNPDTLMDPDLRNRCDDGWLKLHPPMQMHLEDFRICTVRINGIEYNAPSPEFWKEYKKAKVWDRLND